MARLAVIAGKGVLPVTLADNARSLGEDVVVIRIAGQADADFSTYETFDVPLGAVGKTRDMIREAGFSRVSYRNFTGGIAALHSGWAI